MPRTAATVRPFDRRFDFAIDHGYDVLVTMDCDGQHEPSRIPVLLEAIDDCDIVSGSRYLRDFRQNTPVPEDRLRINQMITAELNQRFGLELTDAFCGFKAYRGLCADETGHHRRRLGHAAATVGAGGQARPCACAKSACRGCISIQAGRSAAC